jgi:Predicted hydrolases of HD superfamily
VTAGATDDAIGAPGGALQVRSGLLFPMLAPVPALIEVGDLAASLSKLCRFNGHCAAFYSVAQHAVLVSQIVPAEHARWGLLHDAAEAYIGDLTRPLRDALEHEAPGAVKRLEDRLLRAVAARFGLPWPMPAAVRHADDVLLATERRDLMVDRGVSWPDLPAPLPDPIAPWSPEMAEDVFLLRFNQLWRAL